MKTFALSIFILLTSLTVSAQAFLNSMTNENLKLKKYEELGGDLFLFKANLKADIYQGEELFRSNVDVNYHKEMGEFVALYQGKDIILNSAAYSKFMVYGADDDGTRIFVNKVDPKNPTVYFEVLYDGENLQLLKKYEAKIIEGGTFNYGKGSETAYVKSKEKYYYFSNGDLDEIKLKEKDILKPLPNRSKAKRYAKANDIDFKDEKEVVQLLSMFAS